MPNSEYQNTKIPKLGSRKDKIPNSENKNTKKKHCAKYKGQCFFSPKLVNF